MKWTADYLSVNAASKKQWDLSVRDVPGSGCIFTIALPRHTLPHSLRVLLHISLPGATTDSSAGAAGSRHKVFRCVGFAKRCLSAARMGARRIDGAIRQFGSAKAISARPEIRQLCEGCDGKAQQRFREQ